MNYTARRRFDGYRLATRSQRSAPLNETSSKASGAVLAWPQYLVHVGKKRVDRLRRQRRETGYRSTFRLRATSSVGALLTHAVPALFGCMWHHLRLCFASAFTHVSHARCALDFKANRRIRACFFVCERFYSNRPAQTRYCAEFK